MAQSYSLLVKNEIMIEARDEAFKYLTNKENNPGIKLLEASAMIDSFLVKSKDNKAIKLGAKLETLEDRAFFILSLLNKEKDE